MEFDHFADGLSVFVLVEWIRDSFGGCSRGDCGWMVAWLGIVFGTRQFRKYWIMEKVDEKGNLIGFSILKVSALKGRKPLSISLKSRVA